MQNGAQSAHGIPVQEARTSTEIRCASSRTYPIVNHLYIPLYLRSGAEIELSNLYKPTVRIDAQVRPTIPTVRNTTNSTCTTRQ